MRTANHTPPQRIGGHRLTGGYMDFDLDELDSGIAELLDEKPTPAEMRETAELHRHRTPLIVYRLLKQAADMLESK